MWIEERRTRPRDRIAAVAYRTLLQFARCVSALEPQTLNLEIQTWTRNDRSFIFAWVALQTLDAAIRTQPHRIRNVYLKK